MELMRFSVAFVWFFFTGRDGVTVFFNSIQNMLQTEVNKNYDGPGGAVQITYRKNGEKLKDQGGSGWKSLLII